MNGVPIAGFTLNNTTTNLNTGAVTNSSVLQFCPKRSGELHVQSGHDGNADDLGEQPSDPDPERLCRRRDGDGDRRRDGAPFTNYTKPYVITNLTGQPGDVGIFLPGSSSEMLAIFNVGSVTAPNGGMTNSSYVFGSLNGNGLNGLNGARGTYVNPSNFAARDAAVFANGANIPVSLRSDGLSLPATVGFANQQMVTADSVGANTSSFLTSISSVHRYALRVRIHPVGFLERLQRRNQQQRSTRVRGSGRSAALGRRASRQRLGSAFRRPARPLTPAMRSPISPTGTAVTAISPQARFRPRSISAPATARSRSAGSTEPTMPARPHWVPDRRRSRRSRGVAVAWAIPEGGPRRWPAHSSRAAQPTSPRSTARWAVRSS